MSIVRSRWTGLLGAGALTLTLAACSGDDASPADPTTGTVASPTSQDAGAGATSSPQDGGATQTSTPDAGASEGEEVDVQEFLAMLQSPGEETLSSYTIAMSMNMGGQSVEMDGAADLTGDAPTFDMEMSMPGLGPMRMIMVDEQVFISSPAAGTEEGKFIQVPQEQLGDIASQLDEVDITSTWDAWEEGATSVVLLGEDDMDGQDMRRYEVTVDTQAALDAAGQTGPDAAEASALLGDELTYDVWVDDDNLMRKIAFEMQGVVTEVTTDNWGEPQDIQPPAPEDIQQGGLSGESPSGDS